MKLIKASASIAAILVLLVASGASNADRGYGHRGYHGHRGYYGHHGHGGHWRSGVRLGIVIGAPAYWYGAYPSYYTYPPAYYPPVVTVPSSPSVYIERGDTQAAPEVQNYWYYCPDEKAYYPYVKQCPGGWQRVVPQPPAN